MRRVACVCVLADINLKGWLRRVVFLLHFHWLSVGGLLLFDGQRFFIAWPLVHKGPVLSAELLPHPLGAGAPCRGGERHRAGCAPRRLVPVKPLVGMPFANHSTVAGRPCFDSASSSHQFPFFLCEGLQCSSTLLTSESARMLHTHEYSRQAMSAQAHSTAHEQHTHRLSASAIHDCRSPSAATEMANSFLAPCVSSSVADLSCGWHADGPLVCACCARVSRSIPPSLLLPSVVD